MTENPDARTFAPVPDQAGWKAAKKETTLPCGLSMRYLDLGNPAGPPLVLIHGLGDSSRSWSRTIPPLAEKYRLILPDLRGHGDTDKPVAPIYASTTMADDVAELCRHLGIGRARVVGHSLGGFVAQALAMNYPELVEKLALVATGLVQYREFLDGFYEAACGFGEYPDHAFSVDWCSNVKPVDPDFIALVLSETKTIPGRIWKSVLKGMIVLDLSRLMNEVTAPTLIFWGTADPIFSRADFDALRAALPAAKTIVYEGNGHNIHWEDPEKVVADLSPFLEA